MPGTSSQPNVELICCVPAAGHRGLVANLITLLYYGSPLSSVLAVLRLKSSASLHRAMITANLANTSLWVAYGLVVADYWVYVPNALGAALAVSQLLLCAVYPAAPVNSR